MYKNGKYYKILIEKASFAYAYFKIINSDKTLPSDFQFLDINHEFEKLAGLNAANIINHKLNDIMPGFKKNVFDWLSFYRNLSEIKVNKDFELYSEYSGKWYSIKCIYIKKNYIAALICDITDSKKTGKPLKESEKKYDDFLNNLPGIVYTYSNLRGIIFTSNRVKTILSYEPEEMIINPDLWFNSIHPEDRSAVEESIINYETGKDFKIEYRIKAADDRWIWLNNRYFRKIITDYEIILEGYATDITKRKAAEIALNENNATLNMILDNVTQSIFWKDTAGYYLGCNRVFAENVGFSDSAMIIGKTDYDLPWLKEEADAYREDDRDVIKKNRPKLHFIESLQKADGTRLWADTSKLPLRDTNGHIFAVLGVFDDITERKQYEEKLLNQKKYLQTILQTTADGFWVLDSDYKIIQVNDAYCRMSGYTQEELLNKHLLDINAIEDPLVLKDRTERLVLKGSDFFETKHRRKNGSIFEVEITVTYLDKYGGQFISFIRDITERKKLDYELYKIKSLLEQTNRIADVGGWEYILETGEIIWSSITKAIHEVPEDFKPEIKNRLIFYKNGVDRDAIDNAEKRTIETGEPYDLELRIITGKGNEKWVRRKGSAEFNDGKCVRLYGMTQDIDIIKKLEEEKIKLQAQLTQSQKMESVGRLAGGVAHDFNNMLGVILGHSEMAIDLIDSSHPVIDNLKEIQKAARHSTELTKQLLAFARKQTAVPKVIDLNETIENIIKIITRLIGENIRLIWQPGNDIWQIKMDPLQVEQVLTNLCLNARDSIDSTGLIIISTENIILDENSCKTKPDIIPGEYVALTVADNGIGMDNITIEKLFEPFFTTKEVGKGTGLGLPTVYGITKQNNGSIDVKSQVGCGTVFTIYLPKCTDKETKTEEKEQIKDLNHRNETILIVEDEPAILSLASVMLGRLGYNIVTASSPAEAIQKSDDPIRISLLISDVIMPEMNGQDLSNILKEKFPGLKCLFMSGYTSDIISSQGIIESELNFIQKPFSAGNLADKVKKILSC